MSNKQPDLSRRDWFRLRLPSSQPKLGGSQQPSLQPSAEPVNHGGVDLSSLPPMHEATLNTEEITSLFSDLENHAAEVQLITGRPAPGATPNQAKNLSAARDQLLNGKVKKLQVRYQWENARWIDTLQRSDQGYRLVRIQHA